MLSQEDNSPAPSANRQIARAAGTVMVALVVSQLVGLLAKSLVGQTFGTGPESEAFFAANRFSEILFNLVAGGALASAFIPTFSSILVLEERRTAWKLAAAVANWVTLILLLLCSLAAVFAPQVVRYVLAPGFSATDPAKEALTVALLRIQLPSALIFGLSGLVMGILNAHQRFLLPALAPAMYSLGWVGSVLLLTPHLGIYGLAYGVVIGAGLHLLVQLPALLRLPAMQYRPTLGLDLPAVREVARLMGPRLLGVAVVQLNFLLNTYLASFQPDGSVSGISYAFPLMLMPQAAIAQSVATAALPTFSAQVARGQLGEMRASLAATLRGVLFLAIPASVGLVLLRTPVVALVYHSSEFTDQSVHLVAWALLWYAAGLIGHCVVEIVSRAFYALHDTRTPVLVGTAAMTLNLGFSLLFSAAFTRLGWMPHGGLALANSLATFLEMIGLLVLMRRRLGGLEGRLLWQAVAQAGVSALAMGAGLLVWLSLTAAQPAWLVALGGVAVGGAIYAGLLAVQAPPELKLVWSLLRRRLAR
ncbi:MAG: murein biosynthesis integral membrane protein MurJ [Chloroflexi bacterium]|jgi:putative peptidoglycan lipid II flippase|nr:murein biosynthesis integral membrane protein MurJ [Chloroflexota bacterium]